MVLRLALSLVAGFLFVSDLQAQVPANLRTDSLGDPLPDGAIARLGTRRFKHNNFAANAFPQELFGRGGVMAAVTKAAFSPDGKKIASLGQSYLFLWDADTGKEWPGPWSAAFLSIFAFSQDSSILATSKAFGQPGGVVSEITLWDVLGAKKLRTIEVDSQIQSLALADQGKTLICAGQGKVRWLDAATGKEQRTWLPMPDAPQPAKAPAKATTQAAYNFVFSADAKSLAVGFRLLQKADNKVDDSKGRLVVSSLEVVAFDLATQKLSWRARTKPTSNSALPQIVFAADGKRVVLMFGRDQVEVRDMITGKLVATPTIVANAPNGFLNALAMSHDGKTVAFADNESRLMLWEPDVPDAPMRKFVGRLGTSPNYYTRSLAFSSDGKRLLVAVDADLQLFDTATLKEVTPYDGHRSGVDYVAFSADGKRLLTGCGQMLNPETNEVITWDAAGWKQLKLFSVHAPAWPNIGVASPDHSYFVGKTGLERFQLYDMSTGKMVGRFSVPTTQGKQDARSAGFFSPSGKFYVLPGKEGRGQAMARIYAVPSCKLVCELPGFDALSPSLLFELGIEAGGWPLAFSADEQYVALINLSNGQIHIIETPTGKVTQRIGKARDRGQGQSIDLNELLQDLGSKFSFSPDNKSLVSWNLSQNVARLWDVGTGKERMQMLANDLRNLPVAFAWSPDGRTLAVSGLAERGTIQLWEVAARKIRRVLVGHDGDVRAMAFSPDGKLLASGSADTTVLVWEVWGQSRY